MAFRNVLANFKQDDALRGANPTGYGDAPDKLYRPAYRGFITPNAPNKAVGVYPAALVTPIQHNLVNEVARKGGKWRGLL